MKTTTRTLNKFYQSLAPLAPPKPGNKTWSPVQNRVEAKKGGKIKKWLFFFNFPFWGLKKQSEAPQLLGGILGENLNPNWQKKVLEIF